MVSDRNKVVSGAIDRLAQTLVERVNDNDLCLYFKRTGTWRLYSFLGLDLTDPHSCFPQVMQYLVPQSRSTPLAPTAAKRRCVFPSHSRNLDERVKCFGQCEHLSILSIFIHKQCFCCSSGGIGSSCQRRPQASPHPRSGTAA